MSAFQAFATGIGIIAGGVWAYFRFFKDRIYRPRLEVSITPSLFTLGTITSLVCRVTVENIGTSRVDILQEGTALVLTAGEIPSKPYREPQWGESTVHEVFGDHQWIESGETIHHDVCVALPEQRREALLLRLRLICKQASKNIELNSRVILPPGHPVKEVEQG